MPETTTFDEVDSCTYNCKTCKSEFEYSNLDDPDDHAPLFCPDCGRANAALAEAAK